MNILQTRSFDRVYKKLHDNQRHDVDAAIRTVIANPDIGDAKIGDLSGVFVHKFKMVGQLTLLAYQIEGHKVTLVLLALGPHENFYKNLKTN